MLKHRYPLAAGLVFLLWLTLLTGELLPLVYAADALEEENSRQAATWAALQAGVASAPVSPSRNQVFLGPQSLLKAAREAHLSSLSVDAPKAGNGVYQVSGEASISQFADWLMRLSRLSPRPDLTAADLRVQNDGRLHFVVSTMRGTADDSEPVEQGWPVGNPFCHIASLQEALQAAALSPLERYPLSDIRWIGRASVGSKSYVLFALPGGVTVSATHGDKVGQVKAVVLGFDDEHLKLRLPNGRVLSLKSEKEN